MTEPKTARERAREVLIAAYGTSSYRADYEAAAAIIEADRQAMQEECAERAVAWLTDWIDEQSDGPGAIAELRAAIKGEPK